MTEIVFIGTGDAFGAGGRRQSAIFVRTSLGAALLDCGGTTGTGMSELGLARNEVDAILISHFHGDHFAGIPGFLLASLYEDQRKHPLIIAGPPQIETRVKRLAQIIGYGIEDREWSFPIEFQELRPGSEKEIGPLRARSFETFHQPDVCPHGFILQADRSKIVFSGDTGWFQDLPSHVRGANLFICECTYHRPGFEYHLNYQDLHARQGEFDCEKLILTHLGSQMTDRKEEFEIPIARDGTRLKL